MTQPRKPINKQSVGKPVNDAELHLELALDDMEPEAVRRIYGKPVDEPPELRRAWERRMDADTARWMDEMLASAQELETQEAVEPDPDFPTPANDEEDE